MGAGSLSFSSVVTMYFSRRSTATYDVDEKISPPDLVVRSMNGQMQCTGHTLVNTSHFPLVLWQKHPLSSRHPNLWFFRHARTITRDFLFFDRNTEEWRLSFHRSKPLMSGVSVSAYLQIGTPSEPKRSRYTYTTPMSILYSSVSWLERSILAQTSAIIAHTCLSGPQSCRRLRTTSDTFLLSISNGQPINRLYF